MKKNRLITLISLVLGTWMMVSCATTHPNAKLLVATWKPDKVVKYIDPNAPPAQPATTQTGTPEQKSTTGQPESQATQDKKKAEAEKNGQQSGNSQERAAMTLEKVIQAESRAPLTIYADGTGVKSYPNKLVKVKWKLNKKGTLITARDMKTKETYKLDLLEVNDKQCVIVERTPVGDIKITYLKQE
jgi:hypothetical protein